MHCCRLRSPGERHSAPLHSPGFCPPHLAMYGALCCENAEAPPAPTFVLIWSRGRPLHKLQVPGHILQAAPQGPEHACNFGRGCNKIEAASLHEDGQLLIVARSCKCWYKGQYRRSLPSLPKIPLGLLPCEGKRITGPYDKPELRFALKVFTEPLVTEIRRCPCDIGHTEAVSVFDISLETHRSSIHTLRSESRFQFSTMPLLLSHAQGAVCTVICFI